MARNVGPSLPTGTLKKDARTGPGKALGFKRQMPRGLPLRNPTASAAPPGSAGTPGSPPPCPCNKKRQAQTEYIIIGLGRSSEPTDRGGCRHDKHCHPHEGVQRCRQASKRSHRMYRNAHQQLEHRPPRSSPRAPPQWPPPVAGPAPRLSGRPGLPKPSIGISSSSNVSRSSRYPSKMALQSAQRQLHVRIAGVGEGHAELCGRVLAVDSDAASHGARQQLQVRHAQHQSTVQHMQNEKTHLSSAGVGLVAPP